MKNTMLTGPFLPDSAKGFLGYVLANQGHHEILPLIQNAVECRGKLSKVIHDGNRCADDFCQCKFVFGMVCPGGVSIGSLHDTLSFTMLLAIQRVCVCACSRATHMQTVDDVTTVICWHALPHRLPSREILYLDLALESLVRSAAERGASAFGMGAAPLVAPLLANLILSVGDNEELCYCLKVCRGLCCMSDMAVWAAVMCIVWRFVALDCVV